jgi:hypothetical protein
LVFDVASIEYQICLELTFNGEKEDISREIFQGVQVEPDDMMSVGGKWRMGELVILARGNMAPSDAPAF